MEVPNWYELILLALAAWRLWRLLAEDDILNRPRRWFFRLGDWRKEGDPHPSGFREGLADFVECPYCFGFWLAIGWWAAWQVAPHETLVVAVPFALSTIVVAVARALPSD